MASDFICIYFLIFFTATNVYNIYLNRGEHMLSEYAIHFPVSVLVLKLFAISLNIAARAVLLPFLGYISYASSESTSTHHCFLL